MNASLYSMIRMAVAVGILGIQVLPGSPFNRDGYDAQSIGSSTCQAICPSVTTSSIVPGAEWRISAAVGPYWVGGGDSGGSGITIATTLDGAGVCGAAAGAGSGCIMRWANVLDSTTRIATEDDADLHLDYLFHTPVAGGRLITDAGLRAVHWNTADESSGRVNYGLLALPTRSTRAFTYFVVAKVGTFYAPGATLELNPNIGCAGALCLLGINYRTTATISGWLNDTTETSRDYTDAGGYHVFVLRADGANGTIIRVDGVQISTPLAQTAAFNATMGQWQIQIIGQSALGRVDIYVREAFMYDATLSIPNVAINEAILKAAYGTP